jgi:uncharacterized protein YfaQ (DUF2300 family)
MMETATLRRLLLALLIMLVAPTTNAATEKLDVAWWKDGRLEVTQLRTDGSSVPAKFDGKRLVPLGSLWKLLVYVYAVERNVPTPDYVCTGHQPDEVYCCDTGGSISRDLALSQSCGLFFEPARLMDGSLSWRDYWTQKLGSSPSGEFDWLADPARLKPERLVSLQSLLQVLASLPPSSREAAESALLHVVLSGKAVETVRWFGSRLRVKTFSWHQPNDPGKRMGGAAGWLADGTPVWFAGDDTSSRVLQRWAPLLAKALPASGIVGDGGCVVVDYFARYPIRSVSQEKDNKQVPAGALNGRYRVVFENGNRLRFFSQGELSLRFDPDHPDRPRLRGRFGINEYVARVIDREANASQAEAAKALAIAARSYLQQNAVLHEGCQQIADSSQTQRVSPNPASGSARAIARWTDQLILSGVAVRYHADKPSTDTLSWRAAETQARNGLTFEEILSAAYPNAELTTLGNPSGVLCDRLVGAQEWLTRELQAWERRLNGEAGYERPPALPAVCLLQAGSPYSEQTRNRIFVRGLRSRDDRVTLAHEFLHLGFRNHPRGQDEEFVEQLARRLVDNRLAENF